MSSHGGLLAIPLVNRWDYRKCCGRFRLRAVSCKSGKGVGLSFTLNIVEHELASFGRIVRDCADNPTFEDARLYIAGKECLPDILYLCTTAEDVRTVHEGGCRAAFIGSDAVSSAELSIIGKAEPLVIFDALLDLARRYADWQRAMDRIAYDDGVLQDLIDVSEPFLRNNVVVLDPALKLLGYTKNVPCDDPITSELIEHGYHTEDNIRKFKLNQRFKPWSEEDGFVINDTFQICKYITVVKSFKSRTAFSLISVMMCNVVEPDPYLLDIYQMFVDHVGVFAKRDYPDDKPSGSAVDTFLKDLIRGEIAEEDVAERCAFAGIPYDGRFCLFYMKADKDSVPVSRLLADVSLSVAPAKTILVDDAVVVLCFNCKNSFCAQHCMVGACPNKKRTVSKRLNEMLKRYDLTSGRSSKFAPLSQAPIAFNQAQEAYEISRRPPRDRERVGEMRIWERIYSFDAYALDCLVRRLTDKEVEMISLTYASAILADMARQDIASKTNNYEFLYTYIMNERRITTVAEQLHMHRNNVSYRINRIEEQYDIDTNDPQLRIDLMMAYCIREAGIVQDAQ